MKAASLTKDREQEDVEGQKRQTAYGQGSEKEEVTKGTNSISQQHLDTYLPNAVVTSEEISERCEELEL